MAEKQPQSLPASRQRLDKWLFFTRLTKSRSIAQKAIEGGDVKVNNTRITQPSHALKTGDVVVFSSDRRDTTVRVLAPGNRRGPYEEARLLYEDLTPAVVPGEKPTLFEQATRERGSGRPTKKERREVDRLQADWQDD
ncbi:MULTISPECIES: RNA-binding S4 domain-containing protein [unclassified Rhizobium]|uniref:RNA-binding S4 domain-containing protein n=1 Tax=unclassified Rhizobium TaxID=2613769 RepID=UPI000714B182|nr:MULTISPECIES: RNA-binding S4 domain-containing protein [unclassified Rhizobium]KQS87666.1 RNA-binding protein [Rhizobium sp. Leaf391]KQT07102.1 RNA-binding protein [Rhizobium sp. Leaf386]KQT95228.1 RNA-binding protein [Rhizobium sp. Leaf453]